MKFPMNVPVKIVMLGAGGTGAFAAPHIYRLLYALERPARFIICDGDVVEAKNLNRARTFRRRIWAGTKPGYWPSGMPRYSEWRRSMCPVLLRSWTT